MKQSNKNRSMGRHSNNRFNNNRHAPNNTVTRNTTFDSTSVAGRVRGTSQQLIDKYLSLAKDAKAQDDRVLYETYLQYADHYTRILDFVIQNEQARAAAIAMQQQAQRAAAEALQKEEQMDSIEVEEDLEIPQETTEEVPVAVAKPKQQRIRNKKEVKENVPSDPLIVPDTLSLASEENDSSEEDTTVPQPVVIEIPE